MKKELQIDQASLHERGYGDFGSYILDEYYIINTLHNAKLRKISRYCYIINNQLRLTVQRLIFVFLIMLRIYFPQNTKDEIGSWPVADSIQSFVRCSEHFRVHPSFSGRIASYFTRLNRTELDVSREHPIKSGKIASYFIRFNRKKLEIG